jgi:hypothetical protein
MNNREHLARGPRRTRYGFYLYPVLVDGKPAWATTRGGRVRRYVKVAGKWLVKEGR